MIHNKYFEILKQFLGDYAREVYGRGLIGKVSLSQKGIALALEELEKKALLKSRKQGNMKYYRLNRESFEVRDILMITEFMRKIDFLSRHRKLAHIFVDDERIVGVFGSYARGKQKPDSDIDVFVIGKKKKEDYDKEGRRFDLDVSIKYFSEAEWRTLLGNKNNLCREIISNHVLLFGINWFVSGVWKYYYGFD